MRTGSAYLAIALAVTTAFFAIGGGSAQEPASPITRIAFGSCADQDRPQPIWDAVIAADPDLFLFLGDNVYGDDETAGLPTLRAAYDRAATIPGYAKVKADIPTLAVWDDHDYGRNDGGADYPHRTASQELFLDFWGAAPDDPRRMRPGVHNARIIGPPGRRVQIILLDTRYFRSPLLKTDERGAPGKERYRPDPDPGKTMLGEEQWAWLEERLQDPADIRIIASSIQVIADGHGWERWGVLPLERERLYRAIEAAGAGPVLFVSGDRHVGGLYEERRAGGAVFTEITASSINRPFPSPGEAGPKRLGPLYTGENFGVIDLDWTSRRARLTLRDVEGATVRATQTAF